MAEVMRILRIISYVIGILIFLLALYGANALTQQLKKPVSAEEVSSVVILDRVEKVFKLTTVEGHFSEIYSYSHHVFADVWPFRKQALVRVNARVSVGFNMENVQITIDEEHKTVRLEGPVRPEILSVEHDMDYYNFENGLFNVITNRDITEMSARAKEFIEEKALESDLFDQAIQQKMELFDLLTLSLKAAGWSVVLSNEEVILN